MSKAHFLRRRARAGAVAALRWSFPVLLACCASGTAQAANWLEVGDRQQRSDVEILVAYGLVQGPTLSWPIPAGHFYGLDDDALLARQPEFVREAAARVLSHFRIGDATPRLTPYAAFRFTSEPDTIRDFGDTARNEVDVRAGFSYEGDSFAASIRAGDQTLFNGSHSKASLDGSYLAALLGNWQLYTGYVDQWYGPGWTSSLILSNNARPIPKVGFLRNNPHAFESRWLSWIGTWDLNAFLGLLDGPRTDSNTGFGSFRFSFEPLRGFEVGLTRTIQFCGANHPCKPFNAAFDVRNNTGRRNYSNDEASIDLKYTYAFKSVIFSPYLQFQNEDTGPFAHSVTSHLGGASWAGPFGNAGSQWRLTAEYADTVPTENIFEGTRFHGTAYNNTQYVDGYRYRDRSLGFSLDSDSKLFSLAGTLTDSHSRSYRLVYYDASVSTHELAAITATGNPERNSVSPKTPVRFQQIEAGVTVPYRGFNFDLSVRGQPNQKFPGGSRVDGELGIRYGF